MTSSSISTHNITLTNNGIAYVPPAGIIFVDGGDCSFVNGVCKPLYNCLLDFKLTVSADGKTGVTSATAAPAEGTTGCTPALINSYNGEHVTIAGNPNNTSTKETQAQKAVCVYIATPNGNNAPAKLTVTIGGQKKTLTKSLFTINGQGTMAEYITNQPTSINGCFQLDPNNYQLCAPPILSCNPVTDPNQNFQKAKYTPLNLRFDESQVISVKLNVHTTTTGEESCNLGPYKIVLKQNNTTKQTIKTNTVNTSNVGSGVAYFSEQFNNVASGTYQICLPDFNNTCKKITTSGSNSVTFDVNLQNASDVCTTTISGPPPPPSPPCASWVNGQCTLFDSALGNLSTNPAGFIQSIFAILLSVSGGIALLLIIRAGYQMMTSQGKPEQIQNARDQLIAAIVGLVFLIFSFVFLQLIGYDILHIPGIGGADNATVPQCKAGTCIPEAQACNGNSTHCIHNGCKAGFACEQP